jgi:hypothetical protein
VNNTGLLQHIVMRAVLPFITQKHQVSMMFNPCITLPTHVPVQYGCGKVATHEGP